MEEKEESKTPTIVLDRGGLISISGAIAILGTITYFSWSLASLLTTITLDATRLANEVSELRGELSHLTDILKQPNIDNVSIRDFDMWITRFVDQNPTLKVPKIPFRYGYDPTSGRTRSE